MTALTVLPVPRDEFARLARRLLAERRDEFIRELFQALREQIGELAADSRLAGLLEAAVTENIVSIVNFLEGGTSVEDLDATSGALAHARTLAQRDIPLSALFRAYRIGHAQFVETGLVLVEESPVALRGQLTHLLVRRSAAFIDKVCEQVGRAYEAEHDQWVADRGGIRQHWIGEILSGRSTDGVAAEAALGYRLKETHLGVLIWTPSSVPGIDARSHAEESRRILTDVFSPVDHPLVIARDEHETHAWFPVRQGFKLDTDLLANRLRARVPNVRIAIGRPEVGIEGFRSTIKQAKRVMDVVLSSSNPPPGPVTYSELGPVALMISHIEELQQFVANALGGLAVQGEKEETLRRTLQTFLAHQCSFIETAPAMHMHRNTVRYRITQALELSGHDLKGISVNSDVQVALEAEYWLGRTVLKE